MNRSPAPPSGGRAGASCGCIDGGGADCVDRAGEGGGERVGCATGPVGRMGGMARGSRLASARASSSAKLNFGLPRPGGCWRGGEGCADLRGCGCCCAALLASARSLALLRAARQASRLPRAGCAGVRPARQAIGAVQAAWPGRGKPGCLARAVRSEAWTARGAGLAATRGAMGAGLATTTGAAASLAFVRLLRGHDQAQALPAWRIHLRSWASPWCRCPTAHASYASPCRWRNSGP